jgi:hypothetical protein
MGRLGISAGLAAALLVTAVAIGAGSDVRLHRLHLPPPPAGDTNSQPPATGTPVDPSAPPGTAPPATPPPPLPPPSPPPPPSVGCTTGGALTPVATATLSEYVLTLAPTTTFSAAPALTFRGTNAGAFGHTIAIKAPGATGSLLCGTPTIGPGTSNSITVTNLPVGSYVIYCTIHPSFMHQDITVN